MKVFVSYASEDGQTASEIAAALRDAHFKVFFDRTSLFPQSAIHETIRRELESSDIVIFLLSSFFLCRGRYTLNEVEFAQRKWPAPAGHVFSVELLDVVPDLVPGYLRSAGRIRTEGRAASAAVAAVVEAGKKLRCQRRRFVLSVSAGLAIFIIIAGYAIWHRVPAFSGRAVETYNLVASSGSWQAVAPSRLIITEARLQEAEGYSRGDEAGREKALQLYRKIITDLEPADRARLDQRLLREAEADYDRNYTSDALRKYKALLSRSR
ncbi:MAG: toll/interleukin-1 receptor domain-containing protein [Candidatus Accumulibacter meliphilus]|jgi:hypothetical protein|uniref:Toll/interleukin-1 receptor domain-containing protein n=1 Tax=Candidatus Accumulibacter meliphilus TaxID=2211374 RepID=A0A369XQ94_9PROT|nr:MAG: toll/interleukin-1 receptor domain-containing protein [Candidatus Accumulibacter meliphilus]